MDVVITGDYQPAEKKFEVSRRMLEVCLELGFPVSVLEHSPLVLRDLDLLKEINQRAPSVVFFSVISAQDSSTYERVCIIRNITFQDTFDCFPAWDPTDGELGSWNALYDSISLRYTDHVWVDHNTFEGSV